MPAGQAKDTLVQSLITHTGFISTNGVRLHVEMAGPEDGALIILLHGFPEFWWGWHHQICALARAGFRVVVPDQRGYNLSDRTRQVASYAIDELAKDILGILDHLGHRQAIIAGHDWGAAVAWYLAMHHAESVDKLIIVNVPHPVVLSRALSKPVWSQLRKSWYIFFFQVPRLPECVLSAWNYLPLRRMFLGSSIPGTFSKMDLDRYGESWHRSNGLEGGINWYRAIARKGVKSVRETASRQVVQRVQTPTLILWGDQDAFLEACLADWSLDWVDDGRLVHFPGATHWILHEEAEQVNQLILEFIT